MDPTDHRSHEPATRLSVKTAIPAHYYWHAHKKKKFFILKEALSAIHLYATHMT